MHEEGTPNLGSSVDFPFLDDKATATVSHTLPDQQEQHNPTLKIKLKLGTMVSTRSSRRDSLGTSGSEYHASDKSADLEEDAEGEADEEVPETQFTTTSRGRRVPKLSYNESEPEDPSLTAAGLFDDDDEGGRPTRKKSTEDDDDEHYLQPKRSSRLRQKNLDHFVETDSDSAMHEEQDDGRRLRPRTRALSSLNKRTNGSKSSKVKPSSRTTRTSQRRLTRLRPARNDEEQDDYIDEPESAASGDADGSLGDMDHPESDLDIGLQEPETQAEPEDEGDSGKPYLLRQRTKINYAIPPPIEDMPKPPPKPSGGPRYGGSRGGSKKGRGLGWSASGAELGRWMGMPNNDSDSDNPTRTPRKPYGGINPFGSGAVPAGGMLPGDLAAGGTPSNLGKVGDSALADADPLGVNQNVTFDEVGGLDEHIHSLKEMTLLPLLYPEVFQRFNVTPPRGVLFHGPPGTGKTLLARALAASSRSGGRQISFFMRKGADCLSKWVGEAERQLRLLFEEARNCQPSIIFFDEIDGLAPVRSSKQDQIHASIVSTLLALMDGMDGRGQVVVIGATNRPDAVDPALRRPGRFDREFYFGLPGLDAREKILSIMTRKWEGWDVNQGAEQGEKVTERLKGLAKLTKGYGGADLRALCTEAALNAIQRRYPQVYQSSDRLLLKPETINVGLRDFMISIKKLVPSSARSSTSAATPLPPQFEPLLSEALEKVKSTIQRVLPIEKKLTALEEAEFEDEGGEEGALEREMLSQAMQTLRVYRPRVAIHGPVGMGQGYIGASALHHLEGYHIQSLELGTLLGDSTRTVEAAVVQLFTEAKRHQPSVIYIPSLVGWCAAVNETSRSTVRAMLETLLPTDPILLLAVVDGPFPSLPKDVKAWFGPSRDNRVELLPPTAEHRSAFFEPLLKDVSRPPNQFADGVKRKKRVLEVLPMAPPLEPRKPSAAELAIQAENDQRTIALLKYRLGPILAELKRKFKRFTKRATEEYNFEPEENGVGYAYETVDASAGAPPPVTNGVIDLVGDDQAPPPPVNAEQLQATEQVMIQRAPLYDIDLDRMHTELYKGHYLTPQDFLDDVGRMVHNAEVRAHEDLDRLHKAQAMFTAAQVSILEFDPPFRLECERMAARENQRRQQEGKGKGKEKEKDKDDGGNVPGVQTRRSTRQNGPQDLLTLTDPVKLERRLKRQRDASNANGVLGDSNGSEEEGVGLDGRNVKRSKMLVDDADDERDALDIISPMPNPQRNVRFASSLPQIVEPMGPLGDVNGVQGSPSPLAHYPHHHQHQPPQHPHQQYPHNLHGPHHSLPLPQFLQPQNQMLVDGLPPASPMSHQRRADGFDPALLNPVQPEENALFGPPQHQHLPPHMAPVYQFGMNDASRPVVPPPPAMHQAHYQFGFAGASSSSIVSAQGFAMAGQQHHQNPPQSQGYPSLPMNIMFNDPTNPFNSPSATNSMAYAPQSQPQSQPYFLPQQQQNQLYPPQQEQRTLSRTPSPHRPSSLRASRTPEIERNPTPTAAIDGPATAETSAPDVQAPASDVPDESTAMVVERTPSPPLPDFHVSEDLLQELRHNLSARTEGLNVEQLEQLRATCLGDVWRHRTDWDRDELIKALLKVVDDFLEEVKEVEEGEGD